LEVPLSLRGAFVTVHSRGLGLGLELGGPPLTVLVALERERPKAHARLVELSVNTDLA
jgi:hypothetical protein